MPSCSGSPRPTSVRADADRHRLCELYRRPEGMAGAVAGAGTVARAGSGAGEFRPRQASVGRALAKHAATRGAARPDYNIAHRSIYHVHQRVAKIFPCGRVLLAGDAAHVNNPLGGMGMNGGIQDAFNLADKLTEIYAGADDRCSTATTGSAAPWRSRRCSSKPTAISRLSASATPRSAQEIARRDAPDRGRSQARARIHAQVLDDQRPAPRGRNSVAGEDHHERRAGLAEEVRRAGAVHQHHRAARLRDDAPARRHQSLQPHLHAQRQGGEQRDRSWRAPPSSATTRSTRCAA